MFYWNWYDIDTNPRGCVAVLRWETFITHSNGRKCILSSKADNDWIADDYAYVIWTDESNFNTRAFEAAMELLYQEDRKGPQQEGDRTYK